MAAVQADGAVSGDDDVAVVERIGEFGQAGEDVERTGNGQVIDISLLDCNARVSDRIHEAGG